MDVRGKTKGEAKARMDMCDLSELNLKHGAHGRTLWLGMIWLFKTPIKHDKDKWVNKKSEKI